MSLVSDSDETSQALIRADEHLPSAPAHPLETYIQAATSDNTRKAYRQDIRHFIASGALLPATTDTVIRYLHRFAAELNPRTLSRRLTALKNWHVYQGFPDPTAHPLVKKTLTGIQHIHGRPKDKAPALTIVHLTAMVTHLKAINTLSALRNIALLQVGFFGAFRVSELINIQWEHLNFVPEGVDILIPHSKTDQLHEGQTCSIPYGDHVLCPVTALKTWCEEARIDRGYLFCAIDKNANLSNYPLTSKSISQIIKDTAASCQIANPEHFSSHSLRRGFATAASQRGASFPAIMRHGRWRHEGTVLGYIQEGQRFEDNAASVILKPSQSVQK